MKRNTLPNTGYTSCEFQRSLKVCSSIAKAVTVDSEVVTNYCILQTLNVIILNNIYPLNSDFWILKNTIAKNVFNYNKFLYSCSFRMMN